MPRAENESQARGFPMVIRTSEKPLRLLLPLERNRRRSLLYWYRQQQRGTEMQTVIKADDGDQLTVHADDLSIEQLTIRLEIENPAYGQESEFDTLTMSTRSARELGMALIQAADLVEVNSRELCGSEHFNFLASLN